ncbi:tachykinin-like peptides receptor 86C isoform X1 [Neodiprion virginianus]|uniref:tachykinin-like peptides receptor 86C isoform X1 n=1 Tax=Neodiprion virginianus TaxID=2961670 RepID=UPI001EE77458|nr:tachykinin-like peptides receptor 86C isoform X1 [Neodiprion virginianus]
MKNVDTERLYNCSAVVLRQDLSTVRELNRSDLLNALEEALSGSIAREQLRDKLSVCLFPGQPKPYDLPWWEKLSWALVFTAMLLVAIGGNAIVMWIVLAHRRMRTVTNYFLVNLSVSDLMMSLLNCVFNFIFMLNSDWPFGAVYCTVNNFVANVTVASSVFTLVAISFDRYMAIVRPLQHRMSRRRALLAVAMIWFASALLGLPCLLYSTTMTRSYSNGQVRIVCYMMWPDGRYPHSMTEYIYNLVFLGVTYLVPVTVMAVCYTLMGLELWGSKSIGEHTQRQKESTKSKRKVLKVVRMFIIVVTIFAVCWLPYHGFFIFAYHHRSFTNSNYVQHVYLAFYWLAMSNAMVNPIIYYWMNNRFRVYIQKIICCCFLTRSQSQSRQLDLLAELPHSDLARSRSERLKYTSIQWRQSTTESRVRMPKLTSQLICDEIHKNGGSARVSSKIKPHT